MSGASAHRMETKRLSTLTTSRFFKRNLPRFPESTVERSIKPPWLKVLAVTAKREPRAETVYEWLCNERAVCLVVGLGHEEIHCPCDCLALRDHPKAHHYQTRLASQIEGCLCFSCKACLGFSSQARRYLANLFFAVGLDDHYLCTFKKGDNEILVHASRNITSRRNSWSSHCCDLINNESLGGDMLMQGAHQKSCFS